MVSSDEDEELDEVQVLEFVSNLWRTPQKQHIVKQVIDLGPTDRQSALKPSYSCVCFVRYVTSVFMIFTSSSACLSCLSARCSSFACCSVSFSSLSSLCASSNCSLFNIRSTSVSDLTAGVLLLFFFPELKEEPPSEISSLGLGEGLNELGINRLEVDRVVCAKVKSSGPFASPRRGGLYVSSLPKTRSIA